MLQILSGKFYDNNIKCKDVSDQDIFYSNLAFIKEIKTSIGTLESVNINPMGGISSYLFRLNGLSYDDDNCFNYPEALDQFRVLCSFYFQSVFDYDKNNVEWLCRESLKDSKELIIPSKIIPLYFSKDKIIDYNSTNFDNFIDDVLGLPRNKYKAVINSISIFVQSLEVMCYNLELSFSLMIYSLESLSQLFDNYESTWDNFDSEVKSKLDILFKNDNIDKESSTEIKNILIKYHHPKVKSRFIEFCMNYTNDSFFKDEALNSQAPLKKSDFKRVLSNAYNFRSSYVHSLEKLDNFKEYLYRTTSNECISFEKDVFLSLAGLTRLTHHIITNFIKESEKLSTENFNWFNDLPNISVLPMHPKYWISDTSSFESSEIFSWFSNFLVLYKEFFINNTFCDLRDLMNKIEKLLKGGIKKEFKGPVITFYFLYNLLVPVEYRSNNFNNFIKTIDFNNYLHEFTIENMIFNLILYNNIPWNLDTIISVYMYYEKKKFNKNIIKLPELIKDSILIYIANEFLIIKNYDNFNFWIEKLILDLPGRKDCQEFLQNHINNFEKIDIDTFRELLLKGDNNG